MSARRWPIKVGDRVRFTLPTSRGPRTYEAIVIGHRRNGKSRGSKGWIETEDDIGNLRSIQPGRCEIVKWVDA